MTLLATFLQITAAWRDVFPQARTWRRAVRQALGSLVCVWRRCLSRIIWTNGGQGRSWSTDYFLHSRCAWQPQALFQPILQPRYTQVRWLRWSITRESSKSRPKRVRGGGSHRRGISGDVV